MVLGDLMFLRDSVDFTGLRLAMEEVGDVGSVFDYPEILVFSCSVCPKIGFGA